MSNKAEFVFEDGEWWYKKRDNGTRRIRKAAYLRENSNRMFVNGKYVPSSHPLHRPGRYKTFEDAAFSSLKNYTQSKEGQVYIISNPNFHGWVKVGMAVDAKDRLNNYQTSSPFRDYELNYTFDVEDRRVSEAAAHAALQKRFASRGEWFKCTPRQAWSIIGNVVNNLEAKAA